MVATTCYLPRVATGGKLRDMESEDEGYATPTPTFGSDSSTPGNSKRRRILSFCDTPLSQAETPLAMDESMETTPIASPATARVRDLVSLPAFSLFDSDDGYSTPSEDGDHVQVIRRPAYNQCATTGFAPPEKCFAPWRPRRPPASNSSAGVLPGILGLAAELTQSDIADHA